MTKWCVILSLVAFVVKAGHIDQSILAMFVGRDMAEKPLSFLNSSEGCSKIFMCARENIAKAMTVKDAEWAFRDTAEMRFNSNPQFKSGWCKDFKTLIQWADNLSSSMTKNEQLFVRILSYLSLSYDYLFLLKQNAPEDLLMWQSHIELFLSCGDSCRIFVRDGGGMGISFVERVEALDQGLSLLVITKDWQESDKATFYGKKENDLKVHFVGDLEHACSIKRSQLYVDCFQKDLYRKIVHKALDIVKSEWCLYDLEYALVSLFLVFSIFHEKQLFEIENQEGGCFSEKFLQCLRCEQLDNSFYPIVQSIFPEGYFDVRVESLQRPEDREKLYIEEALEERLFSSRCCNMRQVITHHEEVFVAKMLASCEGVDEYVTQREVQEELRKSWLTQECSDNDLSLFLFKEVVADIVESVFCDQEAIKQRVYTYVRSVSLERSIPLMLVDTVVLGCGTRQDKALALPLKKDLAQWAPLKKQVFLWHVLRHMSYVTPIGQENYVLIKPFQRHI